MQPTQPRRVAIGERRKPRPKGRPGYVRVDTVHAGDRDKGKGVCFINVVDEVTQYQAVGAVETITERHLVPVLEQLLEAFSFSVRGFHADNGSESINHTVADLLRKLHVGEFTKSRPQRSNDNALCESKHGAVVRKLWGYGHLPARWAEAINACCRDHFTPYLNYHRACLFPSEREDPRPGRVRRVYRHADVEMPYRKFRSLEGAEGRLKPGLDFAQLDAVELAMTDTEGAERWYSEQDQTLRGLRKQ